MDITFYTLNFQDKYILPASSNDIGYSSMNAVVDFNGIGSFQLVFRDDELVEFVKNHPEGYFVKWGKFEGYATDYQFLHNQKTIYGSHLNGLLHKAVFEPQSVSDSVIIGNTLKSWIQKYYSWITYVGNSMNDLIAFSTDTYKYGDEVIGDFLKKAKKGYSVYIYNNAGLRFKGLPSNENPIILSKANKNVYELQEDFSNKTAAYGGWYRQTEDDSGNKLETEQWNYITAAEKSGIYMQDVILNANSPAAAADELATYENEHSFLCKTRELEYQIDYTLGDVVRLQVDNTTVKKQITSVDMWYEGATYHEEPTLSEWEE